LDERITARAAEQFGLITWTQLSELGFHPERIKRFVRRRDLNVVHPAVYRIPGHPVIWEQRLMACLLRCGSGSAISFEAAGRYFRLAAVRADQPHVTVVHQQRLKARGFVLHRTRLFAPGDVITRGPLRVTSPLRTMIDLAGVLSLADLEDSLDDAIRRQLVSVRQLQKRLEIRGRRGVAGVRNLERLLAARDGQRPKASGLQNRFRRGLERAGLPAPLEEHEICDASGRFIARVDFAYPDKKIYIEVDGSHHETRKQREADVERQNRLSRAGWRPLRYSEAQVRAKSFVPEIRALFVSGESRGTKSVPTIPQNGERARR
jgi:hypothetical protein